MARTDRAVPTEPAPTDQPAPTKKACPIINLRTVGIPVIDQERALTFYVDILGFEKRCDVPEGGGWK